MNHFVFSAFTTYVAALAAAFYLLTRGNNSKARFFGWYWATIAFWSFTVAFQRPLLKVMPDYIWGWLLHLGCLVIPAVFFHFACFYSDKSKAYRKWIIGCYGLTGAYLFLNTFTSLFTNGVSYRDYYAYPTPSLFYPLYFASFVMMVVAGTVIILSSYKRIQLETRGWFYALVAVHSIAYTGAMDNFLIMWDIRMPVIYPFGLYPVALYAVVGALALNKISLLDVPRERRVFQRIFTHNMPLTFKVDAQVLKNFMMQGRLKDLSKGGALIEVSTDLPAGSDQIEIETVSFVSNSVPLYLQDFFSKRQRLTAKVLRAERDMSSGFKRIAVSFID